MYYIEVGLYVDAENIEEAKREFQKEIVGDPGLIEPILVGGE
jgi:hypothetical protein